jgi:hypothetical protein
MSPRWPAPRAAALGLALLGATAGLHAHRAGPSGSPVDDTTDPPTQRTHPAAEPAADRSADPAPIPRPAPCFPAPPAALTGELRLLLLRDPSVPPRALDEAITGIAQVYAPMGLRVLREGPPVTLAAPVAFPAPTQASNVQISALETIFAAAPARSGAVRVLVLPRIVAPEAPLARALGEPLGLGLSPFAPPEDPLRALLPLDALGPAVLLSWRATQGGQIGAVAAHELGHALGLPHREGEGALMAAQPTRGCGPAFTPAEAAALQRAVDRLALQAARPPK